MKEMFKFMDKMTKLIYEIAELRISNKMLKQELERSANKQDIIDCLVITNDNIFVRNDKKNKLKKILGVKNEIK